MKALFILILTIVLINSGCTSSDSELVNESCKFTDKTSKSLKKFFLNHPEANQGKTLCIKNFPDHFDGDSTKTGVRTEVILEEGRFFFEEYSFSKKYLESRAMEVTFPFALYEDSDREFVSMVNDTLCLMFRAASEADFEVMEPYMTEIELEYLGLKK